MTPAPPDDERGEELFKLADKAYYSMAENHLDKGGISNREECLRAALAVARDFYTKRERERAKDALACAEWLCVVAGVLPCHDESSEDGCPDSDGCPQCTAFKLCEPYFKYRKTIEGSKP